MSKLYSDWHDTVADTNTDNPEGPYAPVPDVRRAEIARAAWGWRSTEMESVCMARELGVLRAALAEARDQIDELAAKNESLHDEARALIESLVDAKLDAAFVEGVRARQDDLPREANPHPFCGDQNTDPCVMWDNGWEWQDDRYAAGDLLRDWPGDHRLQGRAMALYNKLVPMTDAEDRKKTGR